MKKFLFLLLTAFAVTACDDECDHQGISRAESLVGSWYNEEKNEEDTYNLSGTFYSKFSDKEIAGEAEGTYEFGADGKKLTWYYKYMGQNQVADWTITDRSEYSFRINSNYASLLYGKIVESYTMSVGQTQQINFSSENNVRVSSYSSKNDRIAEVSSSGLVTAEGEKGTTYIKLVTEKGDVWVKIVVGSEFADLWFDYISILGKNYNDLRIIFGTPTVNGSDGYSFRYNLTQHSIIDSVDVFIDKQKGVVDEIQLVLKKSISESMVLSYMDSRYYKYDDIGNYILYSNTNSLEKSYAIIAYNKNNKKIIFEDTNAFLQPSVDDLWEDFASLFGKGKSSVKTAMDGYGFPFYMSLYNYSVNGSDVYIINNSDYAQYVEFIFNPNEVVSQYWVYMNTSKDANDVYNYLSKKYNYAEDEGEAREYVFYNQERDLKVVLDLSKAAVIYTKLSLLQHVSP